jgi:hypothetical protein
MVHELDFAHVDGLVEGYERVAGVRGVQSCEIDLDLLRLTFSTRSPLTDATRLALHTTPGLVCVRCWPSTAPRIPAAAVGSA